MFEADAEQTHNVAFRTTLLSMMATAVKALTWLGG